MPSQRVSSRGRAGPASTVLASAVVKVADLTGHRDDAAVLVVRYDGPQEPA
ncbi:hypothetical protein [Streptomyces sp. NPDC093089]|uniref:hypothetical protein n=1 Tax=Streptomyces sp. NPDC093089 TaxID=3366024 RepID=UPI0038063D26